MKKTSGDTVILYIGIIVLLIGASVFVYFRFFFEGITFIEPPKVTQEFVYEKTKECNLEYEKIKNNLIKECNLEYEKSLFRLANCKEILKEIFYSPEKNECIIAYKFSTNYFLRGMFSNSTDKFTAKEEDNSCLIFKNGEIIKKTELGEGLLDIEDQCYPRTEEIWLNEMEKLKRL